MADEAITAGPTQRAAGRPERGKPQAYDLKRQPGFGVIALLCLAVLYAPIIILVVFSFNTSPSVTRWESFSLRWFAEVLANDDTHRAAYNSLRISIIATVVSTIIATAAALA